MALVHDSVCNLLKLFCLVWWLKLNAVLAELRMSWAVLARSSPNYSGPTLWFFEHNGLKSGCKNRPNGLFSFKGQLPAHMAQKRCCFK